jgi:ABC-type phosphate transport system substrate-binding protein
MISSSLCLGSDRVEVVVNSALPFEELSLRELRAIYTMKQRRWDSGESITVFVLPETTTAHKEFCKKILGVFPRQLRSVWYRSVYTGTGVAPIEVETEEELIEQVSQTNGAIGYVLEERKYEKTTKIIKLTH